MLSNWLIAFVLFSPWAANAKGPAKAGATGKSASTGMVHAHRSPFLTSAQFAKLKPNQQKAYVREVRKVMVDMTARSEFMAVSPGEKPQRMPSADPGPRLHDLTEAVNQLEGWQKAALRSGDYSDPKKKDELLRRFTSASQWAIKARQTLATLGDVDENNAAKKKNFDRLKQLEGPLSEQLEQFLPHSGTAKNTPDPTLQKAQAQLNRAKQGQVPPDEALFTDKPPLNFKNNEPYKPEFTDYPTDGVVTDTAGAAPQPDPKAAPAKPPAAAPAAKPAAAPAPAPAKPASPPPAPAPTPGERPNPAAPATVPPPPPAAKPTSDKPAPAAAKPPEAPKPPPEAANPPPPKSGKKYRCMYSGFVISGAACKGRQDIPDGWDLKGVDPEKAHCAQGQVLCNPLLFGLVKNCDIDIEASDEDNEACLIKAKAACVPRGRTATQQCASRYGSDQYLETAAYLIKSNPGALAKYATEFEGLCGVKPPEMVPDDGIDLEQIAEERRDLARQDIKETCTEAYNRLVQLKEKYTEYWQGSTAKDPKATPPQQPFSPGDAQQ